MNANINCAVILLAGGIGSRMQSPTPKQFLLLQEKPVARYSFDLFSTLPNVAEIIVVCSPEYHSIFSSSNSDLRISFALPGARRQDSVFNGLQAMTRDCNVVCIHDTARPCITLPLVQRVIVAALEHGAATAAMPIKYTVKECNGDRFVKRTHDRSRLWEIQTPQAIQTSLLKNGFKQVLEDNLDVTDDVSIIELLGHPVKLVEGAYTNLKITTPEDLALAELFIKNSLRL